MSIYLNASFLAGPACGTRVYTEGLVKHADPETVLVLPDGEWRTVRVSVGAWTPTAPPKVARPARTWLWEQGGLPASLRGARGLLHVPYFAPATFLPRGIKQVVTVLDVLPFVDPRFAPHTRLGRYRQRRAAEACRRASRVIAISRFAAEEVTEVLGLDASRVATIPLSPGCRFFPRDRATVEETLLRHGLRQPYVLYAGGYHPRKRVGPLIDAFRLPTLRAEGVALVLVGVLPAGKGLTSAVERATATGADVRVLPTVSTEDLAALYSGAAASCYLSDYEGYGLPPVEAAACGCPTVLSDIPPLRETLDGVATFLPEVTAESIAAALSVVTVGVRPTWRPQEDWSRISRQTDEVYRAALRE